MRRRAQTELNINHERWLISYSDFVTLLFAFFVVMYSISQVSESKYRVLSDTLTEIFSDPKRSLKPIQVGEVSRANQTTPVDLDNKAQGPFEQTADLAQLSDQFTEQFSDLIDDEAIQVNSNEYWLQISLNNSILFPLGSVDPKNEALPILAEVAELLRNFNNPIQVEGYTDNISVNSLQFPSNWELSAARAASVVKVLIDEGIEASRLAAVGYGEFHPIAENETPEGRAQNRRVVLMIAREKMQRPRIKTSAEVDAALHSGGVESTQVNPQPGLQNGTQTTSETTTAGPTTEEKIQRLIETNPNLGLETTLQAKPSEQLLEQPPKEQISTSSTEEKIVPVETESGGLLFSSDPDLPRANLTPKKPSSKE